MKRMREAVAVILLTLLCVIRAGSSQIDSFTHVDEAASIESVARRFLTACSRQEVKTLQTLSVGIEVPLISAAREWSKLCGRRNIVIKDGLIEISRLVIRGNEATLRVTVKEQGDGGIESWSGDRTATYDYLVVKGEGQWKVSRFDSASRQFLQAYLAAKGTAIEELLKQEHSFLTSDECLELLAQLGERREKTAEKLDRLLQLVSDDGRSARLRAEALWLRGDRALRVKDYQTALSLFQQLRHTAETAKNELWMAAAITRQAEASVYLGDEKQAEAYQQVAERFYNGAPDYTPEIYRGIHRYANAFFNTRQYDTARAHYLRGMKLARTAGKTGWVAIFQKDIGDCYFYERDYLAAERWYRDCLAVVSNLPGRPSEVLNTLYVWEIHLSIGNTRLRQKDQDGALKSYHLSCASAGAALSTRGTVDTYKALAAVYWHRGEKPSAVRTYRLMIDKLMALGDSGEAAQQLGKQAFDMALHAGEFNLADGFLTDGMKNYGARFPPQEYALLLFSSATLKIMKGNHAQALELAKRATEVQGADDEVRLLTLIISMTAYSGQGQTDLALKELEKAKTLAQQLGIKEAITIISMFEMLSVFPEDEDNGEEQAIAKLEKILSDTNDPLIKGMAHMYLGAAYLSKDEEDKRKGNEEIGFKHITESIALFNTNGELGSIMLMQTQFMQALAHHEAGREIEALAAIQQAQDAMAKSYMAPLAGGLKLIESEIHEALGQTSSAASSLIQYIDYLESQSDNAAGGIQGRVQYFETNNEHYKRLISLLIKQKEPDKAVAYAERAKARTLLDLGHEEHEPSWNKYKDLSPGTIINIISDEADDEHQGAKQRISPTVSLLSREELESLVPDERTAVLEFVVDRDKTYLFVFSRSPEPVGVSVPASVTSSKVSMPAWQVYQINVPWARLATMVAQLNDVVRNNKLGYSSPCQQLYEILFRDASPQLAGKKSLIIIPDSFLWDLPFQALQSVPDRFLLEDYEITYAPSISVLAKMRRYKSWAHQTTVGQGMPEILAVGNPSDKLEFVEMHSMARGHIAYGGVTIWRGAGPSDDSGVKKLVRLNPLPWAVNEVDEIISIYGRDRVRKLIVSDTTNDAFQRGAGKYRIIHLATHGILSGPNAFDSAIVMGSGLRPNTPPKKRFPPSNSTTQHVNTLPRSQLLSAWEIIGMKLRAELVVLSACDTAGGGIKDGEGMIGLTWAFAAAGVPTVVASQWAVKDRTTAGLMADFHRRLKASSAGGRVRGTAAALQGAALDLAGRKEYRHPYYWAGFIAMGDTR